MTPKQTIDGLKYDGSKVLAALNQAGFAVVRKSRRKTKPQPRYEIAEDGPERFIVFDNWDDSDCPVFETRNEAIEYVEQQSR